MKFLKSTIAIVALLAIGSVSAKVMKRQGQPVIQPVVNVTNNEKIVMDELGKKEPVVKQAFSPTYIEDIVDVLISKKGFVIDNEKRNVKMNRLVGLVKNQIITNMEALWEADKIHELKTLVNKTLDDQIRKIVEARLTYFEAAI